MPDASDRPGVPGRDPAGTGRGRLPGAHPHLPNALVWAFWALQIAAVMSVVLGIIQRTQTDWLRDSAAQRVEDDPSLTMPSDSDISSFVTSQLVGLVLLGAILGLVGLQVLRGRVRARWYVFGIFLLATVGFAIILPFAYLGIPTALTFITSDDAPIVMTIPVCIASVATTAAFVFTVLRPSRFFYADRKIEDLALAEAAGKTQRQGLLASVLRPPIRPETQAALDKAGVSTGSKRSKAKSSSSGAASSGAAPSGAASSGAAGAVPTAAPAPGAKPSLSKSRAPAEAPDAAAPTARKKGTPRSR